jgi:hypothetical protein
VEANVWAGPDGGTAWSCFVSLAPDRLLGKGTAGGRPTRGPRRGACNLPPPPPTCIQPACPALQFPPLTLPSPPPS